ncbi:EF-hand domain-containing protein [Amaricoccus sp.]|uniref:EF-hand domain-containing protein n=1 Tax=Amaricoccus sp. TaxID=1872485 RepID=UPI001B4899F1|nr:EF-hand domain-containing protein [Amaricoccus sp.]MBP7002891.1 hypothetical protein [Amaricoccus sp.]
MRALLLAAILAATTLAVPAEARPTNMAALRSAAYSPDGLTFTRARQLIPGLQRVTFDKADFNHDGVIDASEFPTFQAVVNAMFRSR